MFWSKVHVYTFIIQLFVNYVNIKIRMKIYAGYAGLRIHVN
jgi:hypothetical protein